MTPEEHQERAAAVLAIVLHYTYYDFRMPTGLGVSINFDNPRAATILVRDPLLEIGWMIKVDLEDDECKHIARALARTAMCARMKLAIESAPYVMGINHVSTTNPPLPGEGPTA